jgi:hypothetical protein
MKVHFHIDTEQVTLDDLIMVEELQSNKLPAKQLKEFVCRFAADESGAMLPHAEALQMVGKMTIAELRVAFEALGAKVQELQATAVPPATSGG